MGMDASRPARITRAVLGASAESFRMASEALRRARASSIRPINTSVTMTTADS